MTNLRQPTVTIKDVAQACGVAPSTVSNALTGKGYVRAKTRDQVIAAATRLGYRASSLARSMRLQRTWTVGVLLADITNPFFPDLVRGMEDVLWARHYNLMLCNTDYDKAKEAAYLHHLVDKRLDGLILASTAADSPEVMVLRERGMPFVMLNRRHRTLATDYIGIDNRRGTATAVQHLAELGHSRIAFIRGPQDSSAAEDRLSGYLDEMRRRFAMFDEQLIAPGDYSIEAGRRACAQFLALDRKPTAIVSANDFMAIGAMAILREQGLSVPRDMSVTGFDDIFVSALPWIDLTTLNPHSRELGARTAEALLARIDKTANGPADIVLAPTLIQRGTTAPPVR
jgi:DNA-binding LacI/PurR family transcriptional regulator